VPEWEHQLAKHAEDDMVEFRRVHADHRAALRDFASRIPVSDQAFFDSQLLRDVAVASWTQAVPARRVAAFEGDEVLGIVTVLPRTGWMAHVGDFRVIIRPASRRQGLGRALVEQGLLVTRELELEKLVAEVRASNQGAIAMFGAVGFRIEAKLERQVRDPAGTFDDLLLLSRWTPASADGP
jgi:ribosomal protein S18 acetylase RimI-like enzyme